MKENLMRVIRFAITGLIGISLYFGILYFLTDYMHMWYLFSATIGFLFNVTSNFLLHKNFTFKNKEKKDTKKKMRQYLTLSLLFLGTNTLFMYILVDINHIYYMNAQIVLAIVVSIISYFTTKIIMKNDVLL